MEQSLEPSTMEQTFAADVSRLSIEQRMTLTEKQILVLHYQQQRIVSEVESEKGTRSRLNADMLAGVRELEKRVRLLERSIWSGIGIIVFLEFLFKTKIFP